MKEIKSLIIEQLCTEYPLEEATQQVDEAEIIIKGNKVKVIYGNGKSDNYELYTIEKLRLIFPAETKHTDIRDYLETIPKEKWCKGIVLGGFCVSWFRNRKEVIKPNKNVILYGDMIGEQSLNTEHK